MDIPGQSVLRAQVQSVLLVVIEEAEARRRSAARGDEPSGYASKTERELV
jgi:hypothetical protein